MKPGCKTNIAGELFRSAVFIVVGITSCYSCAFAQHDDAAIRPIYLVSSDGSDLKPLVTQDTPFHRQGSPVWSSDGQQVAFDAWRVELGEKFSDAHVILTDAGGEKWVDLGDGALPGFSPDGKQICYSRYGSNSGVWKVNVDGTGKEQISDSGWSARWSPDGKWIAYARGGNLFLYGLEAKVEVRNLLTGEAENRYRQIYWSFEWSPDSKYIAFKGQLSELAEANVDEQVSPFHVAVVSVQGSEDGLLVVCERETGNQMSWNPDGTRILFAMPDPSTEKVGLFTANSSMPADPELLEPQPDLEWFEGAAWSPNGTRILIAGRK